MERNFQKEDHLSTSLHKCGVESGMNWFFFVILIVLCGCSLEGEGYRGNCLGSTIRKTSYYQQNNVISKFQVDRTFRLRDLVNIGSQEALTIGVVAILLFGLPQFSFLKNKRDLEEDKDSIFTNKWRKPYKEKLRAMSKNARKQREIRGLMLLEEEIRNGNQFVISKMTEYEKLKNGDDFDYGDIEDDKFDDEDDESDIKNQRKS